MEPYCLVLWLETEEVGAVIEIPERDLEKARAQGWQVLGRESEIRPQEIEPSQRNPNRCGDE